MSTSDPIRNLEQVEQLCSYFREKNNLRNHVLVNLGVCSALRISDMLDLKWENVYDFKKNKFKQHIELIEQKTGKKAKVAINKKLLEAFQLYKSEIKDLYPDKYIFTSQKGENQPISRIQAYKIIKEASEELGIEGNISCHSLRKTFGYHAYKQGYPLPTIMNIFNHSSYEISKRYLCIEQDDKDELYLNLFKN